VSWLFGTVLHHPPNENKLLDIKFNFGTVVTFKCHASEADLAGLLM